MPNQKDERNMLDTEQALGGSVASWRPGTTKFKEKHQVHDSQGGT